MPELPEVEVVRRGVETHVVGRTVDRAVLTGHRVARRHGAGPADLAARVSHSTVLAADRRGKYLWCVLQAGHGEPAALVIHLGMSGQLLVQASDTPPTKHTHAVFSFVDDGPQLRFVDQRTFGGVFLAPLVTDPWLPPNGATAPSGASVGHPYGVPVTIGHIAADPLEPSFDGRAVVDTLKSRTTSIKRALLDQTLVSGIGNIYADEALWRARVNGQRECAALTRPALARVLGACTDVMREALRVGGTTFDGLYVNVNGASGYFDRSLDAYGQTGKPCGRCGTAIVRELFMNRSSHFCPRCQPAPRGGRRASRAGAG